MMLELDNLPQPSIHIISKGPYGGHEKRAAILKKQQTLMADLSDKMSHI